MAIIRSFVAVFCTALTAASAQQLPDVLRPDMGETKQAYIDYSHDMHAHALVDKPSAVQRRNYDVLSYDLVMDWRHPLLATSVAGDARWFTGVNRIRLRMDSANVSTLRLNGAAMTIDSVHCTPERLVQIEQPDGGEWSLTADAPFEKGEEITLEVYYRSTTTSDRGFFLYEKGRNIGPLPNGEMAKLEERLAYTMSEPSDARYWMPCNDLSYDKAMTSIAVRVPKPFTVASNGLLQQVVDEADSSHTFYWKSSNPMPTYLMVAVASIYKEFSHWYHRRDNPSDSIPVMYYVWQKDYDGTALDNSTYNAQYAFRNTVRMMERFSDLYVEYPFEKYGMAVLQPFTYGGMEHQTMTTINRQWIRTFDDAGIAHELMHQWTGDLVTCASFADIWLNEGGATYGEALWAEAEGGKPSYLQTMIEKRGWYLYSPNNMAPIYAPTEIFNTATTYSKAGWVYHMLRQMLGDDVYFSTMKKYFAEFAHKSIETEDMVAFFEREVPNPPVPFRQFFDQWIYSAGHPKYRVSYSVLPQTSEGYPVRVIIEQTQSGTGIPDAFAMPLDMLLLGANGQNHVETFVNNTRTQELMVTVPFAVTNISLNGEYKVLAEVEAAVVGVPEERGNNVQSVVLSPNPAVSGGEMEISLNVNQSGHVEVFMLDVMGRTVGTMYTGSLVSGSYRLSQSVPNVAPGMYFLRIVKDDKTDMVKFIVTE